MPRPELAVRLAAHRQALLAAQRLRQRLTVEARDGVHCSVEGRRYLNFCSNDYLGLSEHPELRAAAQQALQRDGVGAGSAHLLAGHQREHAELEEAFAAWQDQPRALLFGSGYLANLGVVQGLLQPGDLCVQDKLNHACLLDGALLSGASLRRYPHADVEAAQRQLASAPDALALLATDGVFSMDGDLAPLAELAALAECERATLYIDDAHGGGVLGPQGRGSGAHCGLTAEQLPLQLFTLGKAFGSYGGVVVGRAELVEGLLQAARSYLFATALPPALAAASLAALQLIRGDEGAERRQRLQQRIEQFRRGAGELGLPLLPSTTAIQPLLLGSDGAALAAAEQLRQRGLWVPAIRPPTVPTGRSRLRISLSAKHRPADIERLLEGLALMQPGLGSREDEDATRDPRSGTREQRTNAGGGGME